ncbi:MAG TPA: SGNH/GDSL hydrolase family protein [Pirellulales bacterium]|nr:SGNH/GDSL hydrolase family protein [Pirellulales bacterium]
MTQAIFLAACLICWANAEAPATDGGNLLLNPALGFHSFDNSRQGATDSAHSGAVACWNQDAYGDAEVFRAPRIKNFRTAFPVENVVVLHPGKRFYQFSLLAETGLDHGDHVSLSVNGFQTSKDSLQAVVHLMRVDSSAGEWSAPNDKRVFPKHSRGELVKGPSYTKRSGDGGDFQIKLEACEIVGAFTESPDKSTDEPNTIGVLVEFTNRSADQDVWLYAPCLCRGAEALNRLAESRPMPQHYRGIPRTIQKLWRGEPLHVIVMGSSIDRGSANPRQFLYDEDPASPTYKQPLGGADFDGTRIGRPEWDDYIAWWQHYFMYGGRLRRALMQKFDYPIDKLLLNTMACDGSSISEAHSGFADYASLSLPPDPGLNGHRAGKTWRQLYPALFERREGPRPDLVIFGSGANEKVDGADEIALFEGAIRWFQRHYPDTEFLFCMWQNRESYTASTGYLMELSLRYQIPYIDFGRLFHLSTRYANSYALCPRDGHPQAAGHDLWARQLERAFDVADPIRSGMAQLQLPERVNPYTIGWEGEMQTYAADSPRIRAGTAFILDDTVVNLWAGGKEPAVGIRVDGKVHEGSRRGPQPRRDVRNSTFTTGLLSLGDRHIVEVAGRDARLAAVDAKTALERQWTGVESPRWQLAELKAEAFISEWGAPFGASQVVVPAGQSVEIKLAGTDFSVAYVDREQGGTLLVEVDGEQRLDTPTNVPYVTASGESIYLENRRGIRCLAFGVHTLRITTAERSVALLGVFSYDTRANWRHERVLRGTAYPGETLRFATPFKARPVVLATGGLQLKASTVSEVEFAGDGPGGYEIVGE